jgi:hypothetical protein
MSWESRGGKGVYDTRSTRRNGHIQRADIGCGKGAQIIALFDAEERAERAAAAAAWREQKARADELDQLITALVQVTAALATAALLEAGYSQHPRTWRRRRAG